MDHSESHDDDNESVDELCQERDRLKNELKNERFEKKALLQRIQMLKEQNYELRDQSLIHSDAVLGRQYEKCRAAAIALKDMGSNLPPPNPGAVEWVKKDESDYHFTVRSKKVHEYRQCVLQQKKYAVLNDDEFIIENINHLTNDGHRQCTAEELRVIKDFVVKNKGAGNLHPDILVNRRWMKYETLDSVLGVQPIDPSKCSHLRNPDDLKGHKECFAKLNIPKGTILGQYVGTETTKEEYYKIYNGSRGEERHLVYMHGDIFVLPDGREVDLYVDGIDAGDTSPFLYINDGRADIGGTETTEDAERINTEFINVSCNGWLMILIQTTKSIKAGDSLWINYGPHYKAVLDELDLIRQSRCRLKESCHNAAVRVDLEEENPLIVPSDSENEDDSKSITNGTEDENDITALGFQERAAIGLGKIRVMRRRKSRSAAYRIFTVKCLYCGNLFRTRKAMCKHLIDIHKHSAKVTECREVIAVQGNSRWEGYTYAEQGCLFVVQNNEWNEDSPCSEEDNGKCFHFIARNGHRNMNPWVFVSKNIFDSNDWTIRPNERAPSQYVFTKRLRNAIGVRKVSDGRGLIKGQMECYVKCSNYNYKIPAGTIIGKFIGKELLKHEFQELYSDDKERMEHLQFTYKNAALLPNGKLMQIYVDGIAADPTYPLLYINDYRRDVRGEATSEVKERINTEFVMCLVNGWPETFIKTTKWLHEGDCLFIDYGIRYGTVLGPSLKHMDRKSKYPVVRADVRGDSENEENLIDDEGVRDDEINGTDVDNAVQDNHNRKRPLEVNGSHGASGERVAKKTKTVTFHL